MQLNSIQSKTGSTKARNRVGRGNASKGTYCGRGCKGMGQRKSGNMRPGFEGGQTSLISRLPKLRGFKNPNKVIYQAININALEHCFNDGDEINIEALLKKKLIRKKNVPVKILGVGKLTKKLTIKVHKISTSAKEKVVKAGGKVL